jgi:hypothetical protein
MSDEFDFKAKVWTVPGDRAKNGKANVVPLSARALAVVTEVLWPQGSTLTTLTSNPRFCWHRRSPLLRSGLGNVANPTPRTAASDGRPCIGKHGNLPGDLAPTGGVVRMAHPD